MTPDAVPLQRLRWLATGTDLLNAEISRMDEQQMHSPSRLAGWSNAHLLTHLARNADALANLTRWAATGVETPMYPGGADQRLADIESGASRPAEEIIQDVADSAAELWRLLDKLPEETWSAIVRTAQGRLVPASLIPWLRAREVWIHRVDVAAVPHDAGAGFSDLPEDLATVLLPDVVATLATRRGCPALTVRVQDDGQTLFTWPDDPGPVEVAGSRPALIEWLTGRGPGHELTVSGAPLPALPEWL